MAANHQTEVSIPSNSQVECPLDLHKQVEINKWSVPWICIYVLRSLKKRRPLTPGAKTPLRLSPLGRGEECFCALIREDHCAGNSRVNSDIRTPAATETLRDGTLPFDVNLQT